MKKFSKNPNALWLCLLKIYIYNDSPYKCYNVFPNIWCIASFHILYCSAAFSSEQVTPQEVTPQESKTDVEDKSTAR